MTNDTDAAGPDRLRLQLLHGVRPAGPVAVEEVAEALSMTEGGQPARERAKRIEKRLFELEADGLLTFVGMGTKTFPSIYFAIGSIRLNDVSLSYSENSDHQRQRDWEARAWGDPTSKPVPSASSAGLTYTVSGMTGEALFGVRKLLLADGLWSIWGDQWCGVEAAAVGITEEILSTKALKIRLLGSGAHLKNKGDQSVGWDDFIRTVDLIKAARPDERAGFWKLSAFVKYLETFGYKPEFKPLRLLASDAAAPTANNPFLAARKK